jgi:hypothetical protein
MTVDSDSVRSHAKTGIVFLANVQLIQSIPISFDVFDRFATICLKFMFMDNFRCIPDPLCPQDVTYQMEEIAQTKTVKFSIVFRFDVQ